MSRKTKIIASILLGLQCWFFFFEEVRTNTTMEKFKQLCCGLTSAVEPEPVEPADQEELSQEATTEHPSMIPVVVFETHSTAKLSEFNKQRYMCSTLKGDPSLQQKSLSILNERRSQTVDRDIAVEGEERAAICTIQKDEDWYLQEWLDYHLALGFTDIYVFNDGSTNITATDRIHPLPFEIPEVKDVKQQLQIVAFNTCLQIIKQRKLPEHGSYNTTWVAFFDADEFLVIKHRQTLLPFLADHCPNNGLCGAVGINWLWFGTANQTYYEDKPVTQRFLYRDDRPHKIIKSIVRVDEAYCITNAHFPHFLKSNPQKNMSQPPFSYDTAGGILWGPYSRQRHAESAVLHHYTSSLEEWYIHRCRRGDVNKKAKDRRCNGKFPEAGHVYDDSASQFYQTHVIESYHQTAVVSPPPWKHVSESDFGIREYIPLSQLAPEPSDDQIQASSGSAGGAKDTNFVHDWNLSIPPETMLSHLPKGFRSLSAADVLRIDDKNDPPFIQQRHKCLAHVRQLHRERFGAALFGSNETFAMTQPKEIFVLYVDPAYHKNVGDGMLTLGTLSTLLRLGVSDIQQCHYRQAMDLVPPCSKLIPTAATKKGASFKLAVWHPGGNWGDLWVNAQGHRIGSFVVLLEKGYSIFGFPQSLVYFNETLGKVEAQRIKENIGRGLQVDMDTESGVELAKARVTLSWREEKSYRIACDLYPFVTNVAMPDVAFELGPFNLIKQVPKNRKVDVVLFLRDDRESVIHQYRTKQSLIAKIFQSTPGIRRDLTFKVVDWKDRLTLFGARKIEPHHVTDEAIYLVSMGKVIVADRLHATVLAYLSGVPVVYIDQVSGKISKAMDVAFSDVASCRDAEATRLMKASNFTHALQLAARLVLEEEKGH